MQKIFKSVSLLVSGLFLLTSCYDPTQRAETEADATSWQGIEYAPQMYHSEAYDPMSQIDNRDQGLNYWPFEKVGEMNGGHGEFYNSNEYNPHSMNLRVPATNTVRRGESLPYRIPKDSLELASKLVSPFVLDKELADDSSLVLTELGNSQMKDCKDLYLRFCAHCHGNDGQADGLVAEKFGGVPMYNSAAIKSKPIGHIFHVITHGKGRMGSHASQLSQEERWKIATYVQTLQKK